MYLAFFYNVRFNYEAHSFYIAPCNGLQGEPLLFSISALGSFSCVAQHMEPTALRPIRRTNHYGEVSCLGHKCHELSPMLNRYAKTHRVCFSNSYLTTISTFPFVKGTTRQAQMGFYILHLTICD